MIEVGDIVKVKDWGESYSYAMDWFIQNDISSQLMIRYAYGDSRKFDVYNSDTGEKDTLKYEVLAVANDKAFITEVPNYHNNNPAYLVRTVGLVNIAEIHHMTVEEIEEALGYPIEIIKEENNDE